MKKILILLLLAPFWVVGCGTSGSGSSPLGTYNFVSGTRSGHTGCSDEFMAFISTSTEGGETTLVFELYPTGEESLDFEFNDVDAVLTADDNHKHKWSGVVSVTEGLSGCQVSEELTIEVESLEDNRVKIEMTDRWTSDPATAECEFEALTCSNTISLKAKRI